MRGLLLFALFFGLVVSHVNTSYRARRERIEHDNIERALKQEIDALRHELGYFRVQEADKVHILRLSKIESNHYAWRIYLPKTPKWKLILQTSHQVEGAGKSSGSNTAGVEAGEFVLETKIYRSEDGSWKVGMMLPNRSSTSGLQTKSAFAADSNSTSTTNLGNKLDVLPTDKPLILLDMKCEAPGGPNLPGPKITDRVRVLLLPESAAEPPPLDDAQATVANSPETTGATPEMP